LISVAQAWFLSRVRVLGWVLIVAGIVLAVLSFVRVASAPGTNPWPTLSAGFALTAMGIVLLATEGRRRTD
jgi:uncharacterized membrane protein HdeD (DUF308 family)